MSPVLVIRHGRTEWNAAGRIQGRADTPLSATGRADVASWRLPADWSRAPCLASPLLRAIETARLLGLEPQPEPLLIEMDWGAWEGRRLAEIRAELGDTMRRNEAAGLDFRPPGGESPRDVQARLAPLLASLARPTILVTHKGVVRALYALATGWDMRQDPPDKLRDGCAHIFTTAADGSVSVDALNIPLGRA